MAFPDPENRAIDGEITFGKIPTRPWAPLIDGNYKTVFTRALEVRQFPLDGQIIFGKPYICPDSPGDCDDDRPGTGMLYPRG